MLNRAALFATMLAGAGLTAATLLGHEGAAAQAAEPAFQAAATGDLGWHLSHEGDRAKLAYGLANSDQILVMLSCAPGQDRVDVFGLAAPEGERVVLTSTAGPSALNAEPAIDPLSGQPAVETTLMLGATAFRGFRDSGRLTLVSDGEAIEIDAQPEERADVEAFFAHCDRRNV